MRPEVSQDGGGGEDPDIARLLWEADRAMVKARQALGAALRLAQAEGQAEPKDTEAVVNRLAGIAKMIDEQSGSGITVPGDVVIAEEAVSGPESPLDASNGDTGPEA